MKVLLFTAQSGLERLHAASLPKTGMNMVPIIITAAVGVFLLVITSVISGKNRRALFWTLILAAICALSYSVGKLASNSEEERQAGVESAAIVAQMEQIEKEKAPLAEDKTVEEALEEQYEPEVIESREMETEEINGFNFIGKLEIPSLGLDLPVSSEWNYELLRYCPCRYKGTTYADNLIIVAHNYNTHFGTINRLEPGDIVIFSDVYGRTITYEVLMTEILSGDDADRMEEGDWDLTMFTCTPGGINRVTVRCIRMK